jgi:hypothetical protein
MWESLISLSRQIFARRPCYLTECRKLKYALLRGLITFNMYNNYANIGKMVCKLKWEHKNNMVTSDS